jgi:WD40 repeat protein
VSVVTREGFTVRLLCSGSVIPAGVGFVIGDRQIITCAHVVNTALGRGKRTQGNPGSDVRIQIEFPMLGDSNGAPLRSCMVGAWVPPPSSGVSGGDVAGLVLVGEGLPTRAGAARMIDPASVRDLAVSVFGYPGDPPRRENGAWSAQLLRGAVGGGLIQLDADNSSAIRAQPGYSGSPAVVSDAVGDAVVGMLTIASGDQDIRDAYAIPVPQLVAAWPELLADRTIPPCPYRGLRPFTADDAEAGLFVGRETEVSRLRDMVSGYPLVVVAGPSGVGKSSLIAAGLIPALRSEGWITGSFRPGGLPFEALAKALLDAEQPGHTATMDILIKRASDLRLGGLTSLGSNLTLLTGKRILLHADQLEEILTREICSPETCTAFLELMLENRTVGGDGLKLICTLRADFLGLLLQHAEVGSRLQDRLFTLSPMGMERLGRVIEEPSRASGVHYEEGLVQQIARDASSSSGLPLLEFALTELWPHQAQKLITFSAYHRSEGVAGALSRYAERAFADLAEHFSEERIRRVMLTLVRSRGGAAEATRCAASREHLGTDWALAESLAGRRLLVLDHDSVGSVDTAELAHEALIRAWPRFASWVDDDADFQHWLAAVEDRAKDHDLLSDARIAEAERWLIERREDTPEEVVQLIEHSKTEWDRRVTELAEARNRERKAALRAEEATRQEEARRLAAAAELALDSSDVARNVPLALAIESLRVVPTIEGDIAARRAIRSTPLQCSRLDHGGPVTAVAFSPDGVGVATASADYTARVFDAATGTQIRRLDHDGPVTAVAFSPDGRQIATASTDQSARVVDVTTGAELCRLDHDGPVTAVAFSPDGRQIATASEDRSARVFDTATGRQIHRLNHADPVTAVAFSPDGTRIATASADHSAWIVDAATGIKLRRLDHHAPVTAVGFSTDGLLMATVSADGRARVFEALAGSELFRLDSPVTAVTFSPGGTRVAAAGADHTARIFGTLAGAELFRFDHDGPVQAVAFSPDGVRVATASADGSARVFEALAGSELCRLDHNGIVRAAAFSPDGARVAIASTDGSGGVFDAAIGSELLHLDHDRQVALVTFSPGGTRLAIGSKNGSVSIVDSVEGRDLYRLKHDGEVWLVQFRADGSPMTCVSGLSSRQNRVARVVNVATGKKLCRVAHDSPVHLVASSPDGTKLATVSEDQSARVVDVATGTELCRLDHGGPVTVVAFSPDGTRVATASENRIAQVFDTATGSRLCRLDHDRTVRALGFSPDGAKVATASDDQSARVFDAATGREQCRLDHRNQVWRVVFSADGTRVATASEDYSARVFDTATGREQCRLDHDGPVVIVVFSPDGTRLATGSMDGSARVWVVDNEDLMEQAEARLTKNLTDQEWRHYFRDDPYRKTRADQ